MARIHRHYSGVVVTAAPERFEQALEALDSIVGLRVHQTDRSTSRCVVVLESDDRDGQERLFRRVSMQPGVLGVDLAHHWIDSGRGDSTSEEETS